MLLNQLFPHKTCINLDRRPERRQRMQAVFAQHGITGVRHFGAVDGSAITLPAHWNHSAGAYGCLLSHVAVVQQARELGHESVLIFEDDAVLDPEFESWFASFSKQVPPDWDMLHLGALHKAEPLKVQENVVRITKANSTYAYALKHTVFDAFLELNRKAEDVLDVNAYELQERFNCYCFMPNLAWVQPEYSDVQNKLERHWYLEKSLVLFGSHVERLLSETTIVLATHDPTIENVKFLEEYYDEYFAPLAEIIVGRSFRTGISKARKESRLLILADDDLYLEAMDIRANLLMCEEYDGATGFNEVIDLTRKQAQLLRRTGITRGIDVSKTKPAKDVKSQFRFMRREALKRNDKDVRLFQSPNHALRLPSS
jgi:GR25 family glycosyltransferase involved in LPS biosynthesis